MTNIKNSVNWKKEVMAYALIIVGSALFAIADVMFVNPYNLAPGGTFGLSNVFNALHPWGITYYNLCMEIPLLIIGFVVLGPRFGVKTIVSIICMNLFTLLMEKVIWGYDPVIHNGIVDAVYNGRVADLVVIPGQELVQGATLRCFVPDYVLNTLVSGIIYGVAIGLIFRSGATSGGSDIISMIIHKYTKISLGTLVMIVDGCITLTTFVAFGEIRLPIYSLVIIFIEGKIIDLVVDGMKSYKTMFIVTDEMEAVRDYIINDLKRGGTYLSGKGLFQGAERQMIYVTLDRADMVKLRSSIRRIDPNAFVNIMESSEILGKGFKALPEE
ncbi:MAG: YitT family protein [Bacteroidales bacterium]|nr:YitT family protein [Bacteroidales bacterium]